MKFKYYMALIAGKITFITMKLCGKNATQFPGVIANKICPDFLKYIKKPKVLIGVTGTNGKTSTCNILVDFFKSQNLRVMNNSTGSNLKTGIISSFISKGKCDVGVLEIDELASYQMLPFLNFDYFLVTNLFRDSLKRNAHVDYIFNRLNDNIKKGYKLVLNADDLISSSLGKDNEKIYFGVCKLSDDKKKNDSLINDAMYCPKCLNKLFYDYVKYHHIGHAHCKNCSYENPKPDYFVNKITKDGVNINNVIYPAIASNITNIYNEVAVVSLLKDLKYGDEVIKKAFENIKITDIRLKRENVKNCEIIKIAVKGQNAVSGCRVFEQIKKEKGKKQIILITDDLRDAKEGETSAWLYETDFEYLNNKYVDKIIIGGNRRFDSRLRLLLAGYPDKQMKTVKSEYDTYKYIDYKHADKIYIVHDTYNNQIAFKLFDDIKEKVSEK